MSVTRPSISSKLIRSPILIGWVMASWTPATMLAIVCWAAKPMIRPITAVEARMPVASRFSSVNWLSAIAASDQDDGDEDEAAEDAQAGPCGPGDL